MIRMLIESKQNGRITSSSYGSQMTKKIWSCDVILHYKILGYDDKTFLKKKFENVMGSNPNECYGKAVEMLKEQFKEEEGLEILGGSASFNFEE